MAFTLIATGDSLLTRALPKEKSGDFAAVAAMVQESDISFTNLEFTVPKEPWIAAPKANGINMTMHIGSEPQALDDLRNFGFNLFSGANNHSVDYNYPGLVDTAEQLKARGMICAGIGNDLDEAQEPKYLMIDGLRVAVIGAASSFTYGAHASRSRNGRSGRPGINPLRFSTTYQLDEKRMQMLREIDEALGTAALTKESMEIGLLKDIGKYCFLGSYFTQDEKFGIVTKANAADLERISRQIKEARRQADFVIVTLHAHEGLNGDGHSTAPAEFVEETAHTWIDAGADIFIGHGPHRVRPIEVYQGKLIFYSLGNFFFTIESTEKLPSESFDQHGLPDTATPADVHDLWTKKNDGRPNIFMTKQAFWRTVLPVCQYEDREIKSVTLYPITLGQYMSRGTKGLPQIAYGAEAMEILDELCQISESYGTKFTVIHENDAAWAKLIL